MRYCHNVTPSAKELIRRALTRASSQKALGIRLEMSKARVSRVVHGARLSLMNCLRLADVIDELPAVVLRAYGYHKQADVLDRIYGVRGAAPLSAADLHEAVTRLTTADALLVERVISRLASANDATAPAAATKHSLAKGRRRTTRRDV